MLRPRIIPSLLIHEGGLVKSTKFGDYKYVGDPLNAVRIFNDLEADELMVWDIDASIKKRQPDYSLISRLARECRMPLCYGGGITQVDQAKKIIDLGVEKISICSVAVTNPDIINDLAAVLGRQSIVCVLDVKKEKWLSNTRYFCTINNSTVIVKKSLQDLILDYQCRGAGEIVFNSIDHDGVMSGYDFDLVDLVKGISKIPFTFLGGAGSYSDLTKLANKFGVVGCGAGSLFVFNGRFRSVLISYPSAFEKANLFKN